MLKEIRALCAQITPVLLQAAPDYQQTLASFSVAHELQEIIHHLPSYYVLPPTLLASIYEVLNWYCVNYSKLLNPELKNTFIDELQGNLAGIKDAESRLRQAHTIQRLRNYCEVFFLQQQGRSSVGEAIQGLHEILGSYLKSPEPPPTGVSNAPLPLDLRHLYLDLPEEWAAFQEIVFELWEQTERVPVVILSEHKKPSLEHLLVVADFESANDRIQFAPSNVRINPDFLEEALVARRVAYSFLASKGQKPKYENFSLTITIPATISECNGGSAGLAIALAIVGCQLGFKFPPNAIACGHFAHPAFLQQRLTAPYDTLPLVRSFPDRESLHRKWQVALQEGYTRFISAKNLEFKTQAADSPLHLYPISSFEDALREYYGQQWENWLEQTFPKRWQPPGNYIARKDLLKKCEDAIAEHPITILCGLAGIGKTEIARQLQETQRHQYHDTEFIDLTDDEDSTQNSFFNFLLALAAVLRRNGYAQLTEALYEDLSYQARKQVKLSSMRENYLIDLAVRDLNREKRFLLWIDNFEHVGHKYQSSHGPWLRFFGALSKKGLHKTKFVLISTIEVHLKSIAPPAPEIKIPGFTVEEAKTFLKQLEAKYAPPESVLASDIFKDVYRATQGNPAALLYIFALHIRKRRSYKEMLAERELYVVSSERALEIEDKQINVRELLKRLYDQLGKSDQKALNYFSVYRHPVTEEALQHIERDRWFPAVERLEEFFLLEKRGSRYQLYPLAKDYAHTQLRASKLEYQRVHQRAALFYTKETRLKHSVWVDEAIYHYEEAGNHRKASELLEGHPTLIKAQESLKRHKYERARGFYKKYIDQKGRGCSSSIFCDYAYCLEKLDQLHAAIQYYQQASAAQNTRATGRLARLYLQQARKEKALAASRQTVTSTVDDLLNKAFKLYDLVLRYGCEDWEVYASFYQYFYERDDADNIKDLQDRAKESLAIPVKRFDWAKFFLTIAQYHLKRSQENDGINKKDEVAIATSLLKEGKTAIRSYQEFYLELAEVEISFNFHRPEAAIKILLEGVQNTSSNKPRDRGKIELKLGEIYLKKGEEEEAITWFEKSIKFFPHNPAAHFSLAEFFYKRKNYAQALVHLHKTLCGTSHYWLTKGMQLLHKLYIRFAPALAEPLQWWWAPQGVTPLLPISRLWECLQGARESERREEGDAEIPLALWLEQLQSVALSEEELLLVLQKLAHAQIRHYWK